jgi:hypothetical protein
MPKFLLFVFLFLAVCSKHATSAGLDWSWSQSIGGLGTDKTSRMCSDDSGNVFITGVFYGSSLSLAPNVTLQNSGTLTSGEVYIAKYSPSGVLIWARSVGGGGLEHISVVSIREYFGIIYIAGNYEGNGINYQGNPLFSHSVSGKYMYVISIAPNVPNVFIAPVKEFEGGNLSSMRIHSGGVITMIGTYHTSTFTLGNTVLTNANPGTNDIFVLLIDALGNIGWAKSINGNGSELAIEQGSSGGGDVYLVGCFNSITATGDSHTITTNGGYDILVAVYNRSGILKWMKSIGGVLDDKGTDVVSDEDGNIYISGYFSSPSINFGNSTITLPSNWGSNMLLAKYKFGGVEDWLRSGGGTFDNATVSAIALDKNSNIYIAGSHDGSSISFDTVHSIYAPNYLVKFKPDGSALLGISYDGDPINILATNREGDVYVAGEYSSAVNRGRNNYSSLGSTDIWLSKLTHATTGIKEIIEVHFVNVYPNPTANTITIDGDWKQAELTVIDVTGKVVHHASTHAPYTLNTTNFANGNYIINLRTQDGTASAKFVVAK